MPAKCVSSVSPRFHYRRLAFCFLPLAAILESPIDSIYNKSALITITKIDDTNKIHLKIGAHHNLSKNIFWWIPEIKSSF
jgi:hypothetical protein